MSYEKQTWVTGEIVTADKLNHMEDGIADGNVDNHAFIKITIDHTLTSIVVDLLYATLETIDNETRWNIYPDDSTGVYLSTNSIIRKYLPIPPDNDTILCLAIHSDTPWGVNMEGNVELSDIEGSVQNYPSDSWISGCWNIYRIYGDCSMELYYID